MAVKRVLALLVAVGMVMGAFAVRDRDDDGGIALRPERADPAVLVCDPLATDVCRALGDEVGASLEILEPGEFAERLAQPGGEVPAGAWVALEPWVEVAALRRESAGEPPVLGQPALLARSPLVAAVWEDRASVLESHCGTLTWVCVGEVAPGMWVDIGGEQAWGPVKPGLPDAERSDGLLVYGQLAAGYFDRADLTRTDAEDNAFFGWLSRLADVSVRPAALPPVTAMVQAGPAAMDISPVVESQAATLLAGARARAGALQLRVVEPLATADLVVTAVGGDERTAAAIEERAPALLAEAGWRVAGLPLADALDAAGVRINGLPQTSGLPPAGTLLALQQLAQEVRR